MNKLISFIYSLVFISTILIPTTANSEEKKKSKKTDRIVGKKKKKINSMERKAKSFMVTNDYVHTWKSFPTATGKAISGGEITIKPIEGFISVLFFVASWDIKSQELISKFKKIEKKYSNLNTNFYYIFMHDTFEDAYGFAKEFKIKNGVIATHQINKAFHHPKIPSVYVSDRHKKLSTRFLDVDAETTQDFDHFLKYTTIL
jgi:thiol-disulfide isomerase/thioredoxin